jgi:phage terminase large subunit GpA-like protein
MPGLSGIVADKKSRRAGAGMLFKRFAGGSWTLTGSGSSAKARSQTIRYLLLDDVDGFDPVIQGEGDPISLFQKRTDAFGASRKIYINSTPTVKGFSAIDREFENSSKGEYNIRCPHCGALQPVEWAGEYSESVKSGLVFRCDSDRNRVLDSWLVCSGCKRTIGENLKTQAFAGGEWVHEFPENPVRGFRVPGFLSPSIWVPWKQVSQEFLDSEKNPSRRQVWWNTRAALAYDSPGSQPDHEKLRALAEPYRFFQIPRKVLILTGGVDVQNDRLAVALYGWGRGGEVWLIWWGEIFGDPISPEPWEQLVQLRDYPFVHPSGVTVQIAAIAVDTGGHRTNEVYNFCRTHASRGFMAIKGASTRLHPLISRPSKVDINIKGRLVKKGLLLWPVGTHAAKDTIYGRLNATIEGTANESRFHFPISASEDYYKQLTAEQKKVRFSKGRPITDWVLVSDRGEALDCTVYAFAAAEKSGIFRLDWSVLEERMADSGVEDDIRQSPQGGTSRGVAGSGGSSSGKKVIKSKFLS